MAWEKIIEEIDKVRQIVGEWQESGEVHDIEKEVVLEKLRLIYDGVKFVTTAEVEPRREVRPESSEPKTEPVVVTVAAEKKDEIAEGTNIYDAPLKSRHDRKKLMSLYGEGAAYSSGEIHKQAEPLPDVIKTREVADDLPVEEIVDIHAHIQPGDEMGEDVLAAMGLVEEPEGENSVCPEAANENIHAAAEPDVTQPAKSGIKVGEPAVIARDDRGNSDSPKKVLGDTIQPGQTLADVYARNHKQEDVAERLKNDSVHSIRGAIGINDRFLLMRDLFNGDAQACDMAIRTLDGFSDLDDAMLYIHDNFTWNPESDGAKLLIDLLTRKLS